MYAVSAEVKGLDTVVSLLSDAVLQPRLLGRCSSCEISAPEPSRFYSHGNMRLNCLLECRRRDRDDKDGRALRVRRSEHEAGP